MQSRLLWVAAIWILGSLLGISLIGGQPLLALAVVVASGIALGAASVLAYDRRGVTRDTTTEALKVRGGPADRGSKR